MTISSALKKAVQGTPAPEKEKDTKKVEQEKLEEFQKKCFQITQISENRLRVDAQSANRENTKLAKEQLKNLEKGGVLTPEELKQLEELLKKIPNSAHLQDQLRRALEKQTQRAEIKFV